MDSDLRDGLEAKPYDVPLFGDAEEEASELDDDEYDLILERHGLSMAELRMRS